MSCDVASTLGLRDRPSGRVSSDGLGTRIVRPRPGCPLSITTSFAGHDAFDARRCRSPSQSDRRRSSSPGPPINVTACGLSTRLDVDEADRVVEFGRSPSCMGVGWIALEGHVAVGDRRIRERPSGARCVSGPFGVRDRPGSRARFCESWRSRRSLHDTVFVRRTFNGYEGRRRFRRRSGPCQSPPRGLDAHARHVDLNAQQ